MKLLDRFLFIFVVLLVGSYFPLIAVAEIKALNVGLVFRSSDKFHDTIFGTLKGIEAAKVLFEKEHPQTKVKFHRFYHGDTLDSVVEATQRAVNTNIKAVIGGGISDEALAIREVFKGKKIVFVSPTSSNPSVSEGNPFIFRFCPSDKRVALDLARTTKDKLKPRRLGVVHNLSSAYASYLVTEFLSDLKTSDIPSLEAKILGDTLNYDKLIQDFVSNGVTHVFFPARPSEFLNFVHQAEGKSFFPTYIGGDGWGSNNLLFKNIIKNSPSGQKFVGFRTTLWNGQIETEIGRKFEQTFFEMNHSKPNDWSVVGFDAAWTLLTAMGVVPRVVEI